MFVSDLVWDGNCKNCYYKFWFSVMLANSVVDAASLIVWRKNPKHKTKTTPIISNCMNKEAIIKSKLRLWHLAISISKMLLNREWWHLPIVWLLLMIIYSLQVLCLIISTLLCLQLSLWDQTFLFDICSDDLIIIKLKLLETVQNCFDTVRTAPVVICLQRFVSQ